MWSNNDNAQGGGGGGAEGGGGFLDQTYNGQTNDQPKPQDQLRGNCVVPVMISHILSDSLDNLNLWGTPIKLVTVVAFVLKVERATTKISYELVDETGTISAYQWIEENSQTEVATVPAGGYARVVGSPREQGEQRHIFLLRIDPVEELSDIYEHLLEVTVACLKGEEMLTQPEPGNIEPMAVEKEGDSCSGMNQDQAAVFKIIQAENDSESGIERANLRAKLPAGLRGKLDDILEFLVCEGHIYTTCTDDHFKTT